MQVHALALKAENLGWFILGRVPQFSMNGGDGGLYKTNFGTCKKVAATHFFWFWLRNIILYHQLTTA